MSRISSIFTSQAQSTTTVGVDRMASPSPQRALAPNPHRPFWRPLEASGPPYYRLSAPSTGAFSDDIWDWRDLQEPGISTSAGRALWLKTPERFRELFKEAAEYLLHFGAPLWLVHAHGDATEAFTSPSDIHSMVLTWRHFAEFLEASNVPSFFDATVHHYEAWFELRFPDDEEAARTTVKRPLFFLLRLWGALRDLYPHMQLAQPPWYTEEALAEYVPQESDGGENKTPVLPESIIDPLLRTALDIVTLHSTTILEAKREFEALSALAESVASRSIFTTPAQVEAALRRRAAADAPIGTYRGALCRPVLAVETGASLIQISACLKRVPELRPLLRQKYKPAILPAAANDSIPELGFESGIGVDQIGHAWRLLSASAFTVIGYLTGMRVAEVLDLRRGCIGQSSIDRDAVVIRGSRHKQRLQTRLGADEPADEWLAIAPVVTAVEVLERMSEQEELWHTDAISTGPNRGGNGERPIQVQAMGKNLEELCKVIERQTGRSMRVRAKQYPTASMFRRTLAWHISRRPGGTVALAIQYKHLRTTTSEQYGGRRRDGFPEIVALETARWAAEFLTDLVRKPEKVSGPAAASFRGLLENFSTKFEGASLTTRQVKSFMSSSNLSHFYPNYELGMGCHFQVHQAACVPSREGASQPAIEACVSACKNIVRTDGLVRSLAAQRDTWIVLAEKAGTGKITAARLLRAAERFGLIGKQHEETST